MLNTLVCLLYSILLFFITMVYLSTTKRMTATMSTKAVEMTPAAMPIADDPALLLPGASVTGGAVAATSDNTQNILISGL